MVALNTTFKKRDEKLYTFTEDKKSGRRDPPYVRYIGSEENRDKHITGMKLWTISAYNIGGGMHVKILRMTQLAG